MTQDEIGQLRIFEAELKAALLYKNWTLVEGCIEWLGAAIKKLETGRESNDGT